MRKTPIEVLLVEAELTGVPEKRLLKSRNLGAVDFVWPQTGRTIGSLTLPLWA